MRDKLIKYHEQIDKVESELKKAEELIKDSAYYLEHTRALTKNAKHLKELSLDEIRNGSPEQK